MAEQTVSILAVLKDQFSGPLGTVTKSISSVGKETETVSAKILPLQQRLQQLGQILSRTFTGSFNGGIRSFITNTDAAEKRSVQFAGKIARLSQRLISLQIAFQSLTSVAGQGTFGRFQTAVDAASVGLNTFAGIVALFPNKIGVVVGAIAGLAAAFKTVKDQIDDINKSIARAEAQRRANTLRISADQAREDIDKIFNFGARADVDRERKSALQQLEAKRTELRFAEHELFVLENQLELTAEQARQIIKLREDFKRTTEESATLVNTIDELNATAKRLDALDAYTNQVKDLGEQSELTEEKLRTGLITPLEEAEAQLDIAEKKLELLLKNQRLLAAAPETERNFDGAIERAQLDLSSARANLALTEALTAAKEQQAEEEQQISEERLKQLQKEQEELEFIQDLALNIRFSLAGAIGGFIEALIDGTANFRKFLGDVLKGLANIITQALVLKALTAGFGVIGLNTGGVVQRASGGPIPGPDVRRDVVPAMLTPGEYVLRRDAVDHYGTAVMAALNARLVPRSALAGFAGGDNVLNVSGRFAQGGEVVPAGPGVANGPTPAFIVADDQSLDRLLAGGHGAMLRFMERHKDTIGNILERRRV